MKGMHRLRIVAAFVLACAGVAMAAEPRLTPEAGAEQVRAHKLAQYRDVLGAFDRAVEAVPGDAGVALDRCRFIGQFTDDESGDWIDSAPDAFDRCQADLEARWGRVPDVQLFVLGNLWGEEAMERGESLLKQAGTWAPAQRRQLFEQLSLAYSGEDDARAGDFALEAVRLGSVERVAAAVNRLVDRKDYDAAARVLASAPPADDAWQAAQRVRAALALPDRKAALRELARYRGEDTVRAEVVARAHLRAGDAASARRTLDGAEGEYETLQQVRFDTAVALRDVRAAVATVRFTDTGNMRTNLQRFATLAHAMPSSLLNPSMWPGVVLFGAVLLGLALLPGLLLAPAHYRGLARRVAGRVQVPAFPSSLPRAWGAATLFLLVPLLVALVVSPKGFVSVAGDDPDAARVMFRTMLCSMLVLLACLAPFAWKVPRMTLLGDGVAWRAARWRVPAAWAATFATGVLISVWHMKTGGGDATEQTRAVQALAAGGMQSYGLAATLLLVAGLAPVVEELVFRGLLLGGVLRHISFGWSNVFQATAFAVGHADPPRFLFYFVMGLSAGWLVRRTGSLGPAIALHALNNALACLLLTSATG